MICFLYVIAIGACLGGVAWLVERALPRTAPRRWIWCLAIAASLIIPPMYRARHVMPIAATNSMSDPSFWARIQSINVMTPWMIASVALFVFGLVSMWRV